METTAVLQTTHPYPWLYLIPLFPFIGAVVNGIFGKKLQDRFGKKVVHGIAIGAMAAAALVALISFGQLFLVPAHERSLLDVVFPMMHVGSFRVDMAFLMDPLSGMMALIITLIGTGIHVYSTGYMADEPAYWRFFCYLNLFVFSMLLLVLGDSVIIMFFGWEGVGLCSYLLIGFWYKENKNASAGMKAFVVNRVGDWGFVTGAFLLFWGLGGGWSMVTGDYQRDLKDRTEEMQRADDDNISNAYVAARSQEEVEPPAAEPGEKGEKGEHARHEPRLGGKRHVPIGPTVSFRELRNQLALTSADGKRPLVDGGNLDVTVETQEELGTARPKITPSSARVTFDGLQNKTVFGMPLLFLVCLCFFIGACGKSAQIPLYVWLPDAMAGPTPVSALIHAATMVTAGVYMIARLNFLFVLSPGAMTIVATVGALTALFAATIGLFQYDIKKVLAYSTVSQLGFMFMGVGVGAYWAGAFHLLTHACFKACLFLGSGSVIHGMHHLTHHREHAHGHDEHGAHGDDEHKPRADPRLAADPLDPQDMRNMGGLARLMPSTRWTYLIACWAIAGFPWAAGFFSKDEILWKAFSNGSTLVPGWLIWLVGLVAATCTSFYMFRSYYMTFYGRAPSPEHEEHVHESPRSITWVLKALAALCLIIGPVLGFPALLGKLFHWEPLLEKWLEPVTQFTQLSLVGERAWKELPVVEGLFMLLSIGVATLGWYAARSLYFDLAKSEARLAAWRQSWRRVHALVFEKYRVDELYNATVVRWFREWADFFAWFDGKVIDGAVNLFGTISRGVAWLNGAIDKYLVDGAVNLVAGGVIAGGQKIRRIQTGRINNYLLAATAGVVVIVLVAYFV